MKSSLLLLVVLISGLFSSLAQSEGQFYFLAKPGVISAAAQLGQSSQGVSLRWDVLEGALPDDIEKLRLIRKNLDMDPVVIDEILPAWSAGEIMTEAEIDAMYRESGQQQRLMHTLTLLKDIELAEGRDFEPGQFASVLHDRLTNPDNGYWRFLASRQSFNIARALKRAYLDRSASPGTNYEYTLSAIQTGSAVEVILGRATVNTGNTHQLLPVQELKQLVSSCDSSQDHYTVTLDWLAPGNYVTDQVSNNIQLAGYELYRTTENLAANISEPPVRNLANEAAALVHDGRGEVVFSGLERVNRQLLTLDGDGDPLSFEFLEDINQLRAAGLVPGDRRAYYVVGRDFSDHYGETAAIIVQVPNRLSPEAPWDFVAGYRQGGNAGINISWDQVSLENFQIKYPDRVVCNPTQAASTGLVEYVPRGKSCTSPAIARLDVTGYRLYRFYSAEQARGFKDSDGDGVSDRDEYASGMQCDSTQQPVGAVSYSVDLTSLVLLTGDRNRLSFHDDGAQLVENEYYHYRVSSHTADGKFSQPNGPFRVLYPDRTLPALPTFDIVRETTVACCKLVALNASQTDWQFDDAIGLHSTLSLADSLVQTNPLNIVDFGSWSSQLCNQEPGAINSFWGTAAGRRLIYPGQYVDPKATNLPVHCEVDIPESMDLCKSGHWQLYESQCQNEEVVTDGSFGEGVVSLTVHTGDNDSCVDYYEEIAGQLILVNTSCGTDTPEIMQIVIEGGLVCGSVVARDSSNNRSEAVQIPCNIVANPEPPSPPQIIFLDALTASLDFSWRSPLQPTSATLIEISSDVGSEDTQIISFPANNQQPGFEFNDSATVHTLIGARDQWCIRAMAVGLAAENQSALRSPWSGKLCRVRRENGLNDTQYLPWPTIRPLSSAASLSVELAADYVSELQGEDAENLPILLKLGTFTNLFRAVDAGGTEICTEYQQVADPLNSNKHHILAVGFRCRDAGKHLIDGEVDTPFMVYRQARTPQGETGSWVQVSPLLESIYWERSFDKSSLVTINTLHDPYFAMYRHEYVVERDAIPWYLGFVDRYPYILGYEYRYQTVVFTTQQHAIKSWHLSDWILTTGPVNE